MKKRRLAWGAILAGGGAIALAFAIFRGGQADPPHFRLEAVSRGDIEAVVTATGTVNAVTKVEVGSQVSGRISRMLVDYNAPVRAGQVLAEIETLPFRAKVAESEANCLSAAAALERARITRDNLKAKLDRAATLAAKSLISPEEREAAEAAYLAAKSDVERSESSLGQAQSALDSSRLDLAHTTIASPIDGIVISRNMEAGQTVQANFQAVKIFEIATDLSRMRVECAVDEADVGGVAEGQSARFSVGAFPDDEFHGRVNMVRNSPTTSSNVVTYAAIVDVDNPELKLRPGMTASVTILTGEARGVLRVPAAAIRFTPKMDAAELAKIAGSARAEEEARSAAPAPKSAGQSKPRRQALVWRVGDDGRLAATAVRLGLSDGTYVEILTADLAEGQKVITGTESAEAAAAAAAARLRDQRLPPPPPPGGPMGGPPPPR